VRIKSEGLRCTVYLPPMLYSKMLNEQIASGTSYLLDYFILFCFIPLAAHHQRRENRRMRR
jgi:hypothetical protein